MEEKMDPIKTRPFVLIDTNRKGDGFNYSSNVDDKKEVLHILADAMTHFILELYEENDGNENFDFFRFLFNLIDLLERNTFDAIIEKEVKP